jgi:uncharacterized protein (DUF2147 family)
MTSAIRALMLMPLLALAAAAQAQTTPVGLWKTIDDKTGKERSLVRITEAGGVLSGRIERRLDPDAKADDVCDKCTDDRKGKPIQGMEIIRGAKKVDGESHWEGGQILNPEEGKLYRLRLKPLDDGKKLEVRGFIGPFYRNQQWIRVE